MKSRSGAALVIAIVILAAMLLIGLPFLFTQSGSLSGTRSYAHSRLANTGQDSAQSMGIAAGASAVSYRWQQGGVTDGGTLFIDDWSDLFYDLGGAAGGQRRLGVNRIEFDTRTPDLSPTVRNRYALPGDKFFDGLTNADERDAALRRYPTVVGLALEDESGKLDPNHLDTRAWGRLLASVVITDWTDGQTPRNDPGREQLARALALLRYQLPGGRITDLEQLLQAEPFALKAGTSDPVPNPRRALTRAELERLRPYLTLHNPGQARGGLIDLGTILGSTSTDDNSALTLDHEPPAALLAYPVAPQLLGAGTTVIAFDGDRVLTLPAIAPLERGTNSTLANTADDITLAIPIVVPGQSLPIPRMGMAIQAPPTVNLHQAEAATRKSFGPQGLPPVLPPNAAGDPPSPSLLTELKPLRLDSVDALGRTLNAFDLLSPLAVVEGLGTTHIIASRTGDQGASGPFNAGIAEIAPGKPVLNATATVIHVVTGGLDRFPPRGYAKITGKNAETGADDSEIIEYRRSLSVVPNNAGGPLPLSPAAVVQRTEVLLLDVRRGVDGMTGRATGQAKTFLSGTSTAQGNEDRPADLHLTSLVAREQHPVGIASYGVVTIASTATVTDAVGNQVAQDQHRVIAQALPQEAALEARWDKQAAFHALLVQRHGSLLTSFPEPNARLSGVLPQDSPNLVAVVPATTPPTYERYRPYFDLAKLDLSIGMRPALMHTYLSHPRLSLNANQHREWTLSREWTLPFSGDPTQAMQVQTPQANGINYGAQPVGSPYLVSDIRPEGLALDRNRVLAYPNPSNGFLTDAYDPATNTQLSPIQGRQFALWVRPDETWDDEVALLDMRMPTNNVSARLTGGILDNKARDARTTDPRDARISNRFTLVYDPAVQQLILILNPGTIPHAADYGPAIPRQTYGPTTGIGIKADVWPAVNPECLGSGGVHPMASTQPEVVIQHRYYVGNRFTKGEWHLVQVAFSSNQPGGMSIIVDGLVGRDVTRTPNALEAMARPGDHITLPTLVLDTDLPMTDADQVANKGTKALYIDDRQTIKQIALKALAWADDGTLLSGKAAVERYLPGRGVIRIGREYISYQWIDDDGALRDCVRGRRQRTDGGVDDDGRPNWSTSHVMEPHRVGDAVYPGGFAFTVEQNVTWHRGGCHLAQPMPDGDPLHKYQVWSKVGVTTLNSNSPFIPLTGGVIGQFPPRGIVLIGPANGDDSKQEVYYDNLTTPPSLSLPRLLNVHYLSTVRVPVLDDGGMPVLDENMMPRFHPAGWIPGLPRAYTYTSADEVVLMSQEIAGKNDAGENLNPTLANLYPSSGFIQLYDARAATAGANAGRVEWISYTGISSRTDYPTSLDQPVSYLLNDSQETVDIVDAPNPMDPKIHIKKRRGGFWFADGRSYPNIRFGARACHRTGFAAADFSDYALAVHNFPKLTTRVIPVQTNLEIAYLLEAGDVVTLAPQVMSSSQRPIQMCVRYSADDGFPEDKTNAAATSWNSMNRYFAFTEAIPDDWNPGNAFQLLCWPCWTPEDDLSQLNSASAWSRDRLGWVLPWGNAYLPNFQLGVGAPDPRRITFFSTGVNAATSVNTTIDALHAGTQPGWAAGNKVQANIVPLNNAPWLLDEPLNGPVAVRTDQSVFDYPYGLIEVGGEVFAYKRLTPTNHSNNYAELIGRSLLGSTRREHQGTELVLHLPIGPVAEVIGGFNPTPPGLPLPLPTTYLGRVQFEGTITAPAMLLTSRNGERMELTTMPNSHTAPWLRGMYNTSASNWEARASVTTWSNLAPLAIGWWPRYPSALPNNMSARPADAGEFLRCRSYAWAGFPLRFHDCTFTGPGVASVQVLSNGSGMFDTLALALDGTLDWSAATAMVLLAGSSAPAVAAVDASAAFNTQRFITIGDEEITPRLTTPDGTPRAVDGAELRVTWRYHRAALTSSMTPALWLQQAAQNGNRAPMIGPVYLRTRAPNKVLNVER